jgi:hypothetical protein
MKKMKKTISLILVIVALVGCRNSQNYKPSNLTLVTPEQQIDNARNHNLPDPNIFVTKNQKGEVLSIEDLQKLENPESFGVDYYQNEDGVVVEAVLRESRESDKELNDAIIAVFQEEAEFIIATPQEDPELKIIELDCEGKSQFLSDVYDRDQGMRSDSGTIDSQIDHENLEIIISYIEQCGFPTLDVVTKEEMQTIWLVLQHAPPAYQKRYISNFEEAAGRNDIDWSYVALMKDRALLFEGKPQMFGSQVINNELYDLYEPEYVDERSSDIGMGPLEVYLEGFGIEFNIEQKSK